MTALQPTTAPVPPGADPDPMTTRPSRRTVLRLLGVGGAVTTVTFLAGCGSSSSRDAAPGASPEVEAAVTKAVTGGSVPVGGGVVLEDVGAVLTRPAESEYHVFSSYCPHAGGTVTTFEEGTGRPVCVLHGSIFDARTGEVVAGPSPKGLTPYDVPLPASSTAG